MTNTPLCSEISSYFTMTERWSGDTNGRWIFGRLLVQAMKTICANLLSEGLSAQRLVAGWLAGCCCVELSYVGSGSFRVPQQDLTLQYVSWY